MIQAIIFDLDGVLTATDGYHTTAWKQTCAAWNISFSEETADLLRGVSRMECARIIMNRAGKHFTEAELEQFAEEKNELYIHLLDHMTQDDVFEGVVQLLQVLKERNIPMAVASSSKNAPLILEKTKIFDYFTATIDGTMITHSKPNPEVFCRAADALGVAYADCLVVEDAVSGVEAGKAMGAKVAAVGSAKDAPGVDYPMEKTADLLSLFSDELMPHLKISPRPVATKENIVVDGNFRITVLADRLFRMEQGAFTDNATQAVWYRDFPAVSFTYESREEEIIITTDAVTLVVCRNDPAKSEVRFKNGYCAKVNNTQNLLGTYRTLDTNGEHLRIDPSVNQYDRDHIPLDMGVCAKNGVAVYDDSHSLLLSGDGKLTKREGGQDQYIFAYEHDYPAAVRALYALCGSTPVLPRWALGNWWCRYWPYTQQEYLNLLDNFEEDHIPMSVGVIDMDWHHVDINGDFAADKKGLSGEEYGGTDGWTGYTWNKRLFPDHKAFLENLHQRGMHTTLNLHPALGVRWFEKPYAQMASNMGMDPKRQRHIPFQIENDRFVNNYLNVLHHPLEDEGVDFWWIDWQQGTQTGLEGLDPLWALNHYHYLDSAYRNLEGLILSRYAGIGSHRYPVGFSGDIHMDWEFLDYMPYFTATAANVGYGWWSHDIGGHHRGERDEELYLRWLQFGVFSPINRIHCCPAVVTSKEPWTLSAGARALAGQWFRMRHKLIPYLYTASWNNTLFGEPLIRPMYYHWPEEDDAYKADHQYLFGDLLVAPITEHSDELGIASKKVWLPEGNWTDIFSGDCYSGGRWITVYRDSGSMPVFAHAGSILPLDAQPDNACNVPEKFDLWVFAGDGKYTLYEESAPEIIQFVAQMETNTVQHLTISDQPRNRKYHVFFKNVLDGNVELYVNGKKGEVTIKRNRCLQAEFILNKGDTAELIIQWETKDIEEEYRERILKRFIQIPQDNWYKEKQWEKTDKFSYAKDWLSWIESLDLTKTGKGILTECVYAKFAD